MGRKSNCFPGYRKHEDPDYDEEKTHEDLSQITFNDHDGHEMDIEYDEHIWTSPANAMKLVEVITEILKEVSPENAPYFEENKNSYEKSGKKALLYWIEIPISA